MNIDEAIAKIEDIPTIPTILGEILRITSFENSSVKELTRLIYTDQSIVTKILKMANSAFYGLTHKIKTIDRAIVILGFDEVKAIAVAMSVFESIYLRKGGAYYNRLRSWHHSLLCGFGTRILADLLTKDKDKALELYIGGLIHDVGKVLIDRYFPREFSNILELVENKSISIELAEQEILGFDHAFLAGRLLKKWKFPAQLADMVSYHHRPGCGHDNQGWIALIFLADLMCHQLGYSTFVCESKPDITEFLHSDTMKSMKENGIILTSQDIMASLQKLNDQISNLEQLSNIFLPT